MNLRRLTSDEGRAILDIPSNFEAPDPDEIVQDARLLIAKNVEIHRGLSSIGMSMSPIWENSNGSTVVRAAVLPPEFNNRYFSGDGFEALTRPSLINLAANFVSVMTTDDPSGAVHALADTSKVYLSDDAPTRDVNVPYRGHFKVLSLMLADIARKMDAGFTVLEWIASLGLPLEAYRDSSDPSIEEIRSSMQVRARKMWDEEETWMRALLEEGDRPLN